MLSNVSIQKYITSKDIIINPWHDDMMGAARITLYLGTRLLIPDGTTIIDVQKKITPKYQEVTLTNEHSFSLKPHMFVLGETLEEIGLSEKIGMLIEGRSTLARLGISVVQTAMIVDTGQKPKKMTLEIHNAGPNTVLLYPKMKFCRACFFLVEPPATLRYDNDGKYQTGDANIPIFQEEFKKE
jgi:dCTP deaminase